MQALEGRDWWRQGMEKHLGRNMERPVKWDRGDVPLYRRTRDKTFLTSNGYTTVPGEKVVS